METVFEFFIALLLAAAALVAISVAAIIACAVFYGIQSVIEERKEKKEKHD